jgi:hypothetical protein
LQREGKTIVSVSSVFRIVADKYLGLSGTFPSPPLVLLCPGRGCKPPAVFLLKLLILKVYTRVLLYQCKVIKVCT